MKEHETRISVVVLLKECIALWESIDLREQIGFMAITPLKFRHLE